LAARGIDVDTTTFDFKVLPEFYSDKRKGVRTARGPLALLTHQLAREASLQNGQAEFGKAVLRDMQTKPDQYCSR
jgi:hypothetical protein